MPLSSLPLYHNMVIFPSSFASSLVSSSFPCSSFKQLQPQKKIPQTNYCHYLTFQKSTGSFEQKKEKILFFLVHKKEKERVRKGKRDKRLSDDKIVR